MEFHTNSIFPTPLLALVIALCTNLAVAYPPSCSEVYGHPTAVDCATLLAPYLGAGAERGVSHFFGIPGLDRPVDGVSAPQYAHKVDIPKFWSSGRCFLLLFFL